MRKNSMAIHTTVCKIDVVLHKIDKLLHKKWSFVRTIPGLAHVNAWLPGDKMTD